MAACLHQDGDSSDPDNSGPSSLSNFLKQQTNNIQITAINTCNTSEEIKLKGDKVKLWYAIVVVGGVRWSRSGVGVESRPSSRPWWCPLGVW